MIIVKDYVEYYQRNKHLDKMYEEKYGNNDDTSLIIKNSYGYLSYWILAIVSMFVSGIVANVACTMD